MMDFVLGITIGNILNECDAPTLLFIAVVLAVILLGIMFVDWF